MKVLQINSVCGYGSTGRIVADLSRALMQNGDDCLIAYGRGQAPEDIKSIRIGDDFDVYLHGICSRITDRHGFYSKRATQRFIRSAREYDPDIIHLHNLHGYYLHLPTLFEWLRESGKPVVWTLHDCWAFTGHCSHFDYIGCDRWKTGCHDCQQKREYPKSLVFDRSGWNYQQKKQMFTSLPQLTIISPSEWLAGLISESFLGVYPVKVIRNGINLDLFQPVESNDFREQYGLQNKKVILAVANIWTTRKGFDTLMKVGDYLDENYKLVIVGVTPKQKAHFPKGILGIERTDNLDQLIKIYSAADVFVNPTLEDNFPTTNLEAIACGTPVITFDSGGCRETVSDGFGYVVPKGDLKELASQIERLRINQFQMDEYQWTQYRKLLDQRLQYQRMLEIYQLCS